jgi:hypothetical protein
MPLRYRRGKAAGWADASTRVLGWVKGMVGDDEGSAVSLSANLCGYAACGGEETVILFMRRGERTIAFRIAKSVEAVTQTDVAEALQPILAHRVITVR